jgi:hypothetical protein
VSSSASYIKIITIPSGAAETVRMLGVKVYGTASNAPASFVAPGTGVGLAVARTGVPYVANTSGDVYRRLTTDAAWTLAPGGQGANASNVMLGQNDELFVMSKLDQRVYEYVESSSSWRLGSTAQKYFSQYLIGTSARLGLRY